MFEEWEFDFLIYYLKLLYKFLFFFNNLQLICYKFVKYFKIQQVQVLEILYFRIIVYSYRLNYLNIGFFDWIIVRNDYRIIFYIFINFM